MNKTSRQDALGAPDGLPGRLRYVRIEAASWLTPWRGDRPEVAAAPQLALEKWPGILKQPLRRQVCPNCLGPEADDPSLDGEVHPPRARRTLGRLDWLWVSVRKCFVVLRSSKAILHVLAARYEVRGEHLAFINTEGRLAAQFPIDTIQSWNVLSQ
jgi:hypothetical protein